jgi:hypothetical protein
MRITIKSIEAEIIDSRTTTEDHFSIAYWRVKYTLFFPVLDSRQCRNELEGELLWKGEVDIEKILDYIRSLFK